MHTIFEEALKQLAQIVSCFSLCRQKFRRREGNSHRHCNRLHKTNFLFFSILLFALDWRIRSEWNALDDTPYRISKQLLLILIIHGMGIVLHSSKFHVNCCELVSLWMFIPLRSIMIPIGPSEQKERIHKFWWESNYFNTGWSVCFYINRWHFNHTHA